MRPMFLKQLTHAPKNVRTSSGRFRQRLSSNKRMTTPLAALIALTLLVVALVVQAATIEWANAGTTWSTGSNWVGGVPPADSTTTDVASFGSTGAAAVNPNLTANRSVNGVSFLSGAYAYTIGGSILTVGANGISNSATNTETFSNTVRTSASQTWTTGSGGTLVLSGTVDMNATAGTSRTLTVSGAGNTTFDGVVQNSFAASTGNLTFSGTGTLTLNNTNTYTGTTTLSSGTVGIGSNSAFGTGGLTLSNATLQALNASRSVSNNVSYTANGATVSGSQNLTFTGVWTDNASRTLTSSITGGNTLTLAGNVFLSDNNTTTSRTLTILGTGNTLISGVIANNNGANTVAAGLTYGGSSTLTLSNTNTYTGSTTINSGTLALSGTGSFASSPTLTVAGGATFDVSGRSSTLTLGDSQTLSGTGTASSGTINAAPNSGLTMGATSPLTLSYASGIPTLNVTGGALTLQSGNPVTVFNVGGELTVGDYTLISSSLGGSVAGTAPTSVTVTGSGAAANTTRSLEIISGQLILHVTAIPPNIVVNDASGPEPPTGSSNMTFTVVLSHAPASSVSVNFTTADEPPGPGKAVAGTDYTTTSGTVSFAIGERVKTINVPVLSDADAGEPNETFLVNLTGTTGGIITDSQAVGTITAANPAGTLLISELRTSGPSGSNDEFVELYNNSDSVLTVVASDASAGYGLYKMGADCNATPVLLGTIPNGTVIPARGHYLFVGSAYSLANYGGTGAAAGNLTMTSDIENDRNVAIFTTSDLANLSTLTRLDAVGFGLNSGAVCDLLREGTTLPPLAGSTTEHSYFRKGRAPQDTNNNEADFRFADTNATVIPGVTRVLGAPGPENLASPIGGATSGPIAAFRLDTSQDTGTSPNQMRDYAPVTNGAAGTLSIRRRIINNTGGNITRLRFRIYQITTAPSPGGGVADLRALTSGNVPVSGVNDATTCTAGGGGAPPCSVTLQGTMLEEPPTQPNGGGFNSSLVGTPLADGASALVQFVFGVETPGSFNLLMVIEAFPGGGGDVIAAQGSTEPGPTAADSTISGQILASDGNPLPGTVINLNGTQNRKVITDANGNYSFDKVETTGFYTVTPSRANYGFSPGSRSFSQLGNNTEATFTATPAGGFVNALDTPEYFVRQHYLDFLGREPDEAGFNFWSDQILECGADAGCIERRTINVSAAYFLSVEFQRTGGLVDRLYRTSYGRNARYSEFMPDRGLIAHDVVVGRSGWEAQLTANEKTFVDNWVARAAFQTALGSLSNAEYVDHLLSNTGVSFAQAERDAFVSSLNGGTSRGDVLQQIAANENFAKARFNEAFVLMEYFGYLRRDPDEGGYAFWLGKLNQFDGNFERAEMVKAFINSTEYRARFQR